MNYRRLDFLNGLEIMESENEKASFPFHFHDTFCISVITAGTEVLQTKDTGFLAITGAISVTQPGEIHHNRSLAETGYSYKTVYLHPELLSELNNGEKIAALERTIYDSNLVYSLQDLFRRPDDYKVSRGRDLIASLTKYAVLPQEYNKQRTLINMEELNLLIEKDLTITLSTEYLAQHFCLSKWYFIREFRRQTGITPQAYCMIYKLQFAGPLLLAGLPVCEIASELGFCHHSHFGRNFKKYFGVSPAEYRMF